MKLQIRDKEAEIDHVDCGDPLDVFDIVAEDDDTKGNQLYQWIRPLHLDDDKGNPAPRVAEKARNEGINVERVLEENVGSSSADSLEELLRPRPRNTGIPPSSNPTQPQHRADTNDSSIQDQETHLPPEVGMMKDMVELEVVVVNIETMLDHLPDL
ncbi:hypothetical protein TB2_012697 [Malus domestica]